MTITETFRRAVNKGDVMDVRIMMKNSMLVDPSFEEFQEMEYLAQNVPGLYDKHDGTAFQADQSHWDDDYMNQVFVELISNFSHERIAHLQQLVHYLRPVPLHQPSASPRQAPHSNYDRTYGQTGSYRTADPHRQMPNMPPRREQGQYSDRKPQRGNSNVPKVAAAAAAGGVVGGTVAAAAGTSVLVGVAIGVAAVGTITALVLNGGSSQ